MSRCQNKSSRSFHSVRADTKAQFDTLDTFGDEFFKDDSVPSAVAPVINSANSSGADDHRQSTMIRAGEYAAQLLKLPAADEANNVDMDNASVSSAGTSIFHGLARMSERITATKTSRRDLSSEISSFAKLYDDALQSKKTSK